MALRIEEKGKEEVGFLFAEFYAQIPEEAGDCLNEPADFFWEEINGEPVLSSCLTFGDYIDQLKQRELENISFRKPRRFFSVGDIAKAIDYSKVPLDLKEYVARLRNNGRSEVRVDYGN